MRAWPIVPANRLEGILLQAVDPGEGVWVPLGVVGMALPDASHINGWFDMPLNVLGLVTARDAAVLPKGSLEKSPARILLVPRVPSPGTNPVKVVPWRWNFCSPSRKKKVLFCRMGPPIAPPNWFRLNFSGLVA